MFGAEDPETWPGDICDEPIDAQRCPKFEPRLSKEVLLTEFREQITDAHWLMENMPEIDALLWVLDDTAANLHLPWWLRLWYRFFRLRTEPVQPRLLEVFAEEVDGGVRSP
jgi:hypothetical protein